MRLRQAIRTTLKWEIRSPSGRWIGITDDPETARQFEAGGYYVTFFIGR